MKDDHHKRRHAAILVAQSIVGLALNESWVVAKHSDLRVKVRMIDGETIRRDNDDNDQVISVVVLDGYVKKAWVG